MPGDAVHGVRVLAAIVETGRTVLVRDSADPDHALVPKGHRSMDKSYNLFFAAVMGTFVIAIVLAILGMAVWYR